MRFSFTKWQGAGNDFILIEDWDALFPIEDEKAIADLCHRQKGIGADGLLLMRKSAKAHFQMLYFNADGKEVSMCGNGLRCFFHHAALSSFCEKEAIIETKAGLYPCRLEEERVAIFGKMPKLKLPFFCEELSLEGFSVDSGVPHLVFAVDALEEIPVCILGRKLRFHEAFLPSGTNVNFFTRLEGAKLLLRTYERGVEAETLACGTGAIATAFIGHRFFQMDSTIDVVTRSQEVLTVSFTEEGYKLLGSQKRVFTGEIEIPIKSSFSIEEYSQSRQL